MIDDPISFEVIKNALVSCSREMSQALRRTAFSPNIKERRDCSCAIFDAEGRLVAQSKDIPVHLGAMPMSVKACIRIVPETISASERKYVKRGMQPNKVRENHPKVTMANPSLMPVPLSLFVPITFRRLPHINDAAIATRNPNNRGSRRTPGKVLEGISKKAMIAGMIRRYDNISSSLPTEKRMNFLFTN